MQDKELQKKYGEIVFDFQYLKKSEFYEHRIESSAVSSIWSVFRVHLFVLCIDLAIDGFGWRI